VVVCPTSLGTETQTTVAIPTSMDMSVPSSLADQLGVYEDNQGIMRLLGPRGWNCNASYGADGSGGVAVYPPGQAVSEATAFTPSDAEGVVADETSACTVCREGQACPLFSVAASDYQQDYNGPCPASRPATEAVEQISPGVLGFLDPPGVAGDGVPSGGPYPANGVMTYYSGDESGSWLDTCTLPTSEHQLCTVVLNQFVLDYGTQ
jgi:hypothetical protein